MTFRARPSRCAVTACVVLLAASMTHGFIDPERPVSWLIGECRTIAALKVTTVEKDHATFAVVRTLKGELEAPEIVIRWTATQKPPVQKECVGAAAVLLVPVDDEDPTLIQVSPEYLSLTPDETVPGSYEFVRLNGFVKGSFNGEANDFLRLIDDILNKRAYFPIWADTSFAPAHRIGDLPDAAAALAVADLDRDGRLDIVAGTARGLVAFTPDGKGGFAVHPLKEIGFANILQMADADGDGRSDVLTDSGLFLNTGDWQFAPATGTTGKTWSTASFCRILGRPAPAIAVVEAGRARLLVRGEGNMWTDDSAGTGLDKGPDRLEAVSIAPDGSAAALLTTRSLTCMEAGPGRPLRKVQSLALDEGDKPELKNPRLCQRDLDGDGIADVFLASDGRAAFFRRLDDGTLLEIADHLGDVRKTFQEIEGCTGLICEEFNNDGLIDVVIWSKSRKISLIMNRGYHNLREGTDIFDLPAALKDVEEVQTVAVADIDDDGDLDLIVAAGNGLYVLSNTFETKPHEANDRPRNPLLTVRAPGRFGALVTLEDKDGKPLASGRIGEGPVTDTVYFGYRDVAPAAVVLTTTEGRTIRQAVEPGKPVVFR